MTRDERMPWSSIQAQLSDVNGVWAFLGVVFTTMCFAALAFVKLMLTGKTSRDANLTERESNLVEHMAAELNRLNTLVTDLDSALKTQAIEHREAMQRERDECNAKMAGMKGEIELLKRRMSDEEQRDA